MISPKSTSDFSFVFFFFELVSSLKGNSVAHLLLLHDKAWGADHKASFFVAQTIAYFSFLRREKC